MALNSAPTTGYLVWRLSMKWRASVDRALAPVGLTHAQYSLLASLYGLSRTGARPSQRQLADYTGLDPIYVSKLVCGLERDGVVRRTTNRNDSRAFELELTQRGQEQIVAAIAIVFELQEENLKPIGGSRSEKNEMLAGLLEALLGANPEAAERTAIGNETKGE